MQAATSAPLVNKLHADYPHSDHTSITKHATKPNRFTPLAQETRATLPTNEAAFHLNLACQTMRIYACKENGPLRPLRVNGRLHWKTEDLRRLLCVVPA